MALRRPSLPAWVGKVGWAVVSIGMFCGDLGAAVGNRLGRSAAAAAAARLPGQHRRAGQVLQHHQPLAGRRRHGRRAAARAGGGLHAAGATIGRVLSGLVIASVLSVTLGVAIRYFLLFERLTLPTITLLAPVSPIAWLPVAIFMFGIGNRPAVFMVVVALLFHMTLSTVAQIDGVNRNFIHVARTMGASKRQIYARVIVPAILPGMLLVLRMNLFAAWMAVLIAETTGVGYGLGQVIMLARNTFNPSLVFFTIALIGVLGFSFDFALRLLQNRLLYWVPKGSEALRGL